MKNVEALGREIFTSIVKSMVSLGYKQSQGDHTLFIENFVIGKLTLLLVHVDDMIIVDDET